MNNRPDKNNNTCNINGSGGIWNAISSKMGRLNDKDFTCPFCREVIKGISAFGRHLKGHCT